MANENENKWCRDDDGDFSLKFGSDETLMVCPKYNKRGECVINYCKHDPETKQVRIENVFYDGETGAVTYLIEKSDFYNSRILKQKPAKLESALSANKDVPGLSSRAKVLVQIVLDALGEPRTV